MKTLDKESAENLKKYNYFCSLDNDDPKFKDDSEIYIDYQEFDTKSTYIDLTTYI